MEMGNAEVECNLLMELQQMGFSLEVRENDAEIWLSASGCSLQNGRLLRALEIAFQLQPNECAIEDGRIRLWWD